jgi:hypothetical protein
VSSEIGPKLTNELWGAPVRTRQILDHTGSCAFTADTALVVRPDGYIARITHPDNLTDSSSLVAHNPGPLIFSATRPGVIGDRRRPTWMLVETELLTGRHLIASAETGLSDAR